MRVLLVALALSWSGLGAAQSTEDLPEMCAATYIFQGEEQKLLRWKGMFQLRSDVVLEYYMLLQRYEDEDDLPAELLQQAEDECDVLLNAHQSQQSSTPPQTTSQASVVGGSWWFIGQHRRYT